MLPDLRLLIPATVATFFLAAAAGLFASVRVAQDSLVTHADSRSASEDSPITRISMNWPMPGANRSAALRELSDIVKTTALAPLAPPAPAAFTTPVVSPAGTPAPAPAESSPAAPAAVESRAASAPQAQPVPEMLAALPEPSSDSDGRPDLPPLAGTTAQPETTEAEPETKEAEPEAAKTESTALLSEPEQPQQAEQEPAGAKPEPALSDIPAAPETTGELPQTVSAPQSVTQTPSTTEPVPLPVAAPVVASRPMEPEDSDPQPEAREVPEVVVRKPSPRRNYRARRPYAVTAQSPKPRIKPAPDINELEPYERYSRSPANIFFTPVF